MRGKALSVALFLLSSQDHPRLCGEKRRYICYQQPKLGSPPPMRGKVILVCNLVPAFRITPAYAGKSTPRETAGRFFVDHPRLCGEKIFSSFSHAPQTGSPPPMRGKVFALQKNEMQRGITPAYAGKRFRSDRKGGLR